MSRAFGGSCSTWSRSTAFVETRLRRVRTAPTSSQTSAPTFASFATAAQAPATETKTPATGRKRPTPPPFPIPAAHMPSRFPFNRNRIPALSADAAAQQDGEQEPSSPQSPPSPAADINTRLPAGPLPRAPSFGRNRLTKPRFFSSGARRTPTFGKDSRAAGSKASSDNVLGCDIPSGSLDMSFGASAPSPAAAAPGAPTASATHHQAARHGSGVAISLETRLAEYRADRERVVSEEAEMAFDHNCRVNATRAEVLADGALRRARLQDDTAYRALSHTGYGNQRHTAFSGDHFLTNVALIKDTKVMAAARRMPKGAHLHIHYNACLKPDVLLKLAQGMDRMFITSDLPLVLADAAGPDGTALSPAQQRANFFLCEIQFSILSPEKENPGNLFSADYRPRQTMPFRAFLKAFPANFGVTAMEWLESKLVFGPEETYDIPQTASGAWERFNGRTRMMKGLFNYVTVYRRYTEAFLQDLLDDNIQYAEIRPNFMTTNQLWNDEGTAQLDNAGIVELIVTAVEAFRARHRGRNFDGIKIIYCTPRSFANDKVEAALDECLLFKQRWPTYIAGFDLVGEEAKGRPLKDFAREFCHFQAKCAAAGVDIPFLFHCGETLDMGTDVDGNLYDALALRAKRIGHGFALPRHPAVLQKMKAAGVCVEVCPISNEVLGLTPRIGGHAVYSLLAQNMPCTVNSDNGTLFQSSLSHDFYQVLVGKADMGLFGWRQLAEWSLTHACLDPEPQREARDRWLDAWRDFVIWLLEAYGGDDKETKAELARVKANKTLAANRSIRF